MPLPVNENEVVSRFIRYLPDILTESGRNQNSAGVLNRTVSAGSGPARQSIPGAGLLCNQVSFNFTTGRYLFEELQETPELRLKRVFIPEHGLFAELQDQLPRDSTDIYDSFKSEGSETEFVSLYGSEEKSLVPDTALLEDLDILIVDLQDVGARYYTFLTTMYYTMQVSHPDLQWIILDRPNPAGSKVEGTRLHEKYGSFVGVPGMIHRHGLTAGEIALMFHSWLDDAGIHFPKPFIVKHRGDFPLHGISPSPNMPSEFTPLIYSGQCLLEGTNLSEGRGTTRPFEIFGSPFLEKVYRNLPAELHFPADNIALRPLQFVPAFHKHANKLCYGWQYQWMSVKTGQSQFHSLMHSADLIVECKNRNRDFDWNRGVYEYRSDLPAIELLAGDDTLLEYLYSGCERHDVVSKMQQEEKHWIQYTKPFLLYSRNLYMSGF